jgi:hypothetical protein
MSQYARPDSDIALNSWTYSTGSTLYECIDEVTPSDTDYIQRAGGGSSTCEMGLSTVTDPTSSINHTMRLRGYDGGGSTITVNLYCGATLIKAWSPAIGESYETVTYTLTGTEADNITNYGDLEVWIYALAGGSATRVSWFEFEVPDANGVVVINADAATITASGQVITIDTAAVPITINTDAAAIAATGQSISIGALSAVVTNLAHITLTVEERTVIIDAGSEPGGTIAVIQTIYSHRRRVT